MAPEWNRTINMGDIFPFNDDFGDVFLGRTTSNSGRQRGFGGPCTYNFIGYGKNKEKNFISMYLQSSHQRKDYMQDEA